MVMKKLLLLGMLTFATVTNAAGIKCIYVEDPCDEQGNHYQCSMFGWAHREFCSEYDQSRRPTRFFTEITPEEIQELEKIESETL